MRKVIICIIAFVLCICMVGCGTSVSNNGMGDNATSKSSGKTLNINRKNSGNVAETFIECLVKENYEGATELLNIPDRTFYSASDTEYYVPRSSFEGVSELSEYKNISYSSQEINKNNGIAQYRVIAKYKDENDEEDEVSFAVKTVLDSQNKWLVSANEFYNTDWLIRVPGGETEIFINDVAVKNKFITNKNTGSGYYNDILIPVIGKKNASVRCKSKNFDYAIDMATGTGKDADEKGLTNYAIKEIENEDILSAVKNLYNEAWNIKGSGKSAADMASTISSSADTNLASTIFNQMPVDRGVGKNTNVQMTECILNTDYSPVTYYVSDKVILTHFKYSLSWIFVWNNKNIKDSNYSMNYISSLFVAKEDDGAYKIQNIRDENLFGYVNSMTKKW